MGQPFTLAVTHIFRVLKEAGLPRPGTDAQAWDPVIFKGHKPWKAGLDWPVGRLGPRRSLRRRNWATGGGRGDW